jgi:hypothetical protein
VLFANQLEVAEWLAALGKRVYGNISRFESLSLCIKKPSGKEAFFYSTIFKVTAILLS